MEQFIYNINNSVEDFNRLRVISGRIKLVATHSGYNLKKSYWVDIFFRLNFDLKQLHT
jgi:hypothetical protein